MNERNASELLQDCHKIFVERGKIYGSAVEHYSELATLQNAFSYNTVTAKDVVMNNVLEKLDRMRRADDDETYKDSIMDAINYLAIAWEVS